jgi:hypothetical protein
MDSSGSEQGSVASYCEHGNEPSGSKEVEDLHNHMKTQYFQK